MAVDRLGKPRMLKAAIKNTHINSQNTIVPMIAGTLRRMPMWAIESAKPLRSAAVCKPIFSQSKVTTRVARRANDVADDDHYQSRHDLRREHNNLVKGLWKLVRSALREVSNTVTGVSIVCSFPLEVCRGYTRRGLVL